MTKFLDLREQAEADERRMTNPVPTHAPKTDTPAGAPRETDCKCIGGKYGYCDLCTHAHMVEACCADLRRKRAPVEGSVSALVPEDLRAEYNSCFQLTRSEKVKLIERIGLLESTLAAERASRDQIIQLHNDAAVEAIQRSQEYMAKYDKLVAEGWDVLKAERASRLQADTEQFNAGRDKGLREAAHITSMGSKTPTLDILDLVSKPTVSPEQEKP